MVKTVTLTIKNAKALRTSTLRELLQKSWPNYLVSLGGSHYHPGYKMKRDLRGIPDPHTHEIPD